MKVFLSRMIGLLSLSCLLTLGATAQVEMTWDDLEDVSYSIKNGSGDEMVWGKPKFGDSLKELDGKKVAITGYVLPITVDRKEFILSRYHFAECFFCGNGGPETIMEMKLKEDVKKPVIDRPVRFVGTLKLNKKPYELMFFLEEAEMK